MTTQTRNDPWSAWNLWTALIALVFFMLWLLVCPLHVFGGGLAAVTVPSINRLASTDVTSNPVALTGTGTPNSSLRLRIGDQVVGPISVGADGTWSTSANISGLSGKRTVVAESLSADGRVGPASKPLELNITIPAAGTAQFDYPADNERLNAQDYALSGTGIPGERLEIWQTIPGGRQKLETVAVGTDGRWNSYVPATNPATKPGTYSYEIRKVGGASAIASRKVIIEAGLRAASNAKCPCRLRIFTNRKQNVAGSSIVLFRDGKRVDAGTGDRIFTNLAEGQYTFTVSAPGYEAFTEGAATLPKNKNFEVYLQPKK